MRLPYINTTNMDGQIFRNHSTHPSILSTPNWGTDPPKANSFQHRRGTHASAIQWAIVLQSWLPAINPPIPFFLIIKKEPLKQAKILLSAEPSKSLEREQKCAKKQGKSQNKKQGKRKKQGLEGQERAIARRRPPKGSCTPSQTTEGKAFRPELSSRRRNSEKLLGTLVVTTLQSMRGKRLYMSERS